MATDKMDAETFAKMTYDERMNYFRSPDRFKTSEEIINSYDLWASHPEMEKKYHAAGYKGPMILATTVQKYLPDKKDATILDVGAGVGVSGEKMMELGYTNIDFLDPSMGMVDAARTKKVYRNFMCAFFTDHMDEIETNSYDALVSLGFIAPNHLKCEHLPEMIRCVKPGGIIVHVGNAKYLATLNDYKDKIDPYMKQLEEDGKWSLLERTITPDYHPNVNGVTLAYRVTK